MLSYPPTWPTPENEAEKFTIARCWQTAKRKARQAGLDPTITVVSFPSVYRIAPAVPLPPMRDCTQPPATAIRRPPKAY